MDDDLHPVLHVRELAKRGDAALLVEMTGHDDPEVVESAVLALGKLGSRVATSRLADLLDRDDLRLRRLAAHALERIADERAAEPLLRTLQHDEDGSTRWYAAAALGRIRERRAVPALIDALADRDVRDAATRALGRIGDVRAVEPLRALRLEPWRWYMRSERRRAIDEIRVAEAERTGVVREPLVDVGTDLWADGAAALLSVVSPIAFAALALDAELGPLVAFAAAKAIVVSVWWRHLRRRPSRLAVWRERARRLDHRPAVERRSRAFLRRLRWIPPFVAVDFALIWALALVIAPELAGGLLAGGLGWAYLWLDAAKLRRFERRAGVRLLREHDSRDEREQRTFLAPRPRVTRTDG